MVDTKKSSKFNIEEEYKKYQNVLKGAKEGEVHTRFPPEPSGFLHIGHVKASMINYHYAKMYKGTMTFRFDDTNPSKEKTEFVESIISDLKTLGIEWAQHTNTSDHFEAIKVYADDLIKRGLAYCDDTPAEEMKTQRQNKIESKYRNTDPQTNADLFAKMWVSKQEPKEQDYSQWCLRVKIDMQSKNGVMRDPVIYRVNYTPHWKTGTKYVCYPTYDFICPIVDAIEGVTYAMRTMEYADRDHQYKWFQDTLSLRKVNLWEFSRLNMQYTLMSKRKLQWFVDEGIVTGWDDPRMPTVKGILRRGLHVESLTQFMLEQGPSQATNCQTWDKLWAINKKFIDPIAPRLTALKEKNISKIFLKNVDKTVQYKEVPINPLNEETSKDMGNRNVGYNCNMLIDYDDAVTINAGDKITLMRFGNVLIESKIETKAGNIEFIGEYLKDDKDFKKTQKINWLCQDVPNVKVNLLEYDHLITQEKYDEETMVFEDIINKNTKACTVALSDPYINELQVGTSFQYERRGYYKIDKKDPFELIFTPDGKAGSMTKNIQKQFDQSQNLDDAKLKKKQQKQQNQAQQPQQEEAPKISKSQQKKLDEKAKKEKKQQEQEQGQKQQTQQPQNNEVIKQNIPISGTPLDQANSDLQNTTFLGSNQVSKKDVEFFNYLKKQKWNADAEWQRYPQVYQWYGMMNNFSSSFLESLLNDKKK